MPTDRTDPVVCARTLNRFGSGLAAGHEMLSGDYCNMRTDSVLVRIGRERSVARYFILLYSIQAFA